MKEVKRPWGNFKQFVLNRECTVKIIEVKPNEELSLQKHKKRTEHWYFLTSGYVQIGNEKRYVKKGEQVIAPKNKPHRIIAKKNAVQVLEIAFGTFDENDEIRIEDKYQRKSPQKK